jgi:uncharacterized DUF497 family protein
VEFEYDPAKSAANLAKHGIDFEQAKALWEDEHRIQAPTRTEQGERRSLVIGKIGGRLWTAVVTHRSTKVRIISVRRSRGKAVTRYEDEGQDDQR